jgi:hypothetical protein
MSSRNNSRQSSSSTALFPYSFSYDSSRTAPRLIVRTTKTSLRHEVEVTERKVFTSETTKRWTTDFVIESEETFA